MRVKLTPIQQTTNCTPLKTYRRNERLLNIIGFETPKQSSKIKLRVNLQIHGGQFNIAFH